MKFASLCLTVSVLALALPVAPAFAGLGACEGAAVKKRPDDRIRLYTICMENLADKHMAGAYHNRGVAYLEVGDLENALSDINTSLQYDSEFGLGYFNRAIVYARLGDFDLALEDLDYAVEAHPTRIRTDAYLRRGALHEVMGDYASAIADYEVAMQRRGRKAEARLALASLLATAEDASYRDGARAVALAEDALERKGSAYGHATLAAAYAESGQFEVAVREQTLALQMAAEEGFAGDPELTTRLALYQAGQPYREAAVTCGVAGASEECDQQLAWVGDNMRLSRTSINVNFWTSGSGELPGPF
jgi:tetratricopeptide (TPR) repeat protein